MEHGSVKVGMLILMQPDLKKAVDFYKKLEIKENFYLEGKWAEFDFGCVKLGLCPTDQEQDNIRTGIVLEVFHDLKALYEKLKNEGVYFFSEPITAPHGIMVAFKDPGGNIVDLYQPTPEIYKEFIKSQKDNSAYKAS
ncbi:VOC family protein [Candidatus Dependentiae bacterium]|nr:VOC family protein [Candidatus Dependentiae bacterium]